MNNDCERGIILQILGTGIDIVENHRFEKMLVENKEEFFLRIFTENERNYCNKFKRNQIKAQHYAARFAAKEAFVKALGTGIRNLRLKDLNVKRDSLGAPYFEISDNVGMMIKDKGIMKIHLSISHSDNYSIAMVTLEGRES